MQHRIGFVNGCFDILHIGHIRLLKFAKSKCDHLIVCIDSNERVKKMKGQSRPFNSEILRKETLMALESVDQVEIFDSSQELIGLIKAYHPDIMVVGSDYRDKVVIGSQYAKQLIFFDRIEGYSTSKIIESFSDRG